MIAGLELQKEVMRRVKAVIKREKKAGVVGMSAMNLYAITPTATLTCSVPAYREAFAAVVRELAKRRGFEILSTDLDFSVYEGLSAYEGRR